MLFLERIAAVAARWHISSQVAKFIVSGGIVALTELSLLYIFTDVFGIWYLFSLVFAFVVAFCLSFSLQKFWTFQNRKMETVHLQASSYLFVAILNLALNAGALYLLVRYFGLWYILAQALISIVLAIGSFLIYKYAIFKKHEISSGGV